MATMLTTTAAATMTTNMTSTQTTSPPPPEESEDITPDQKLAVMCILSILSVFGTLGNGLVLYVFSSKGNKVTSTIFILALAWTDIFTCLVIIPMTITFIANDSNLHFDWLCKLYQFLITFNVPLAAFIMVAIAVDRYFSICHPFMHAVTPRRARITVCCLCMLAFLLGTITALAFGYGPGNPPAMDPLPSGDDVADDGNSTFNYSAQQSALGAVAAAAASSAADAVGGGDAGSGSESVRTTATVSAATTTSPVAVIRGGGEVVGYAGNETIQIVGSSEEVMVIGTEGEGAGAGAAAGEGGFGSTAADSGGELMQQPHVMICRLDEDILSFEFTINYQKFYASFYLLSLLAVFIIYAFIYRSVVKRREWRRRQRSSRPSSKSPITITTEAEEVELRATKNGSVAINGGNDDREDGGGDQMMLGTSGGGIGDGGGNGCGGGGGGGCSETKSLNSSSEKKASKERRDFNFLANIRTAAMLFVVTLVFIVSFLPAWLMAVEVVNFHIVIFYLYFVYNVANPVIYAFMNHAFRKELKRVFQRGINLCRV